MQVIASATPPKNKDTLASNRSCPMESPIDVPLSPAAATAYREHSFSTHLEKRQQPQPSSSYALSTTVRSRPASAQSCSKSSAPLVVARSCTSRLQRPQQSRKRIAPGRARVNGRAFPPRPMRQKNSWPPSSSQRIHAATPPGPTLEILAPPARAFPPSQNIRRPLRSRTNDYSLHRFLRQALQQYLSRPHLTVAQRVHWPPRLRARVALPRSSAGTTRAEPHPSQVAVQNSRRIASRLVLETRDCRVADSGRL